MELYSVRVIKNSTLLIRIQKEVVLTFIPAIEQSKTFIFNISVHSRINTSFGTVKNLIYFSMAVKTINAI